MKLRRLISEPFVEHLGGAAEVGRSLRSPQSTFAAREAVQRMRLLQRHAQFAGEGQRELVSVIRPVEFTGVEVQRANVVVHFELTSAVSELGVPRGSAVQRAPGTGEVALETTQ